MDKSMILLGAAGYVTAVFKDNIVRGLDMTKRRFTSAIMIDDSYEAQLYDFTMKWIRSLNNPLIANNVSVTVKYVNGLKQLTYTVLPGVYYVKLDKLTFAKISIVREKVLEREINRIYIYFVGKNHRKQKSFTLDELSKYDTDQLFVQGPYGCSELKDKRMDDLFMDNKEDVLKAIHNWVNMKDYYISHKITYKLGMLLHGEPGTGKSSFVTALANELGYNVQMLDPRYLREARIKPRSINVIEDIDCILGNTDRDKDDNTKAQSSTTSIEPILQLLDGIQSPNDCIFILTTNHKENLDPALFRPGRIDMDIHMGKISHETAIEMCNKFGIDPKSVMRGKKPVNPSKLQLKILDKQLYKNLQV